MDLDHAEILLVDYFAERGTYSRPDAEPLIDEHTNQWLMGIDLTDARRGKGKHFALGTPDFQLEKTVADTYGDFPSDAMLRELSKILALKF